MKQIIVDFGTRTFFGLSLPLRVYGYGLMLVLGFLVSIYVAQRLARRAGENPEHFARVGLLSLVGGIVGSRAAYIIQHWDSQFAAAANPLGAMLDVTSGGLIYYGGVVLATAMVLAYLLIKRLPVRRYLDILAVPIMIGLAFGRAGCTLNGCCFGGACRHDWALGMRFPIFSKPLLKLDGRGNPYSQDTNGPSPVYAHQLSRCRIHPPEELIDHGRDGKVLVDGEFRPRKWLHAPRYLHGALTADQTAVWADPNGEPGARQAFEKLAGDDRLLDQAEWDRGLVAGNGLLRGSEHWDEALRFDADHSFGLSSAETMAYLNSLRRRFDTDGDGRLAPAERERADRSLRTDQLALAGAQWSLPVKPAQPLGILNALLLAVLVGAFHRLRRREGEAFALLMVLYPITRFVLELIRDDNPHNILSGVFTHNQYTSAALTTIGILTFLLVRLLPASAGPSGAARQVAVAGVRKTRRT